MKNECSIIISEDRKGNTHLRINENIVGADEKITNAITMIGQPDIITAVISAIIKTL